MTVSFRNLNTAMPTETARLTFPTRWVLCRERWEKPSLTVNREVLCDVDKSGNTEVTDALLILQYSVGKISCFEAEGRPIISEKSKYFGSTLTLEQGKKYAVDEYKQLLNFRTPNANYTNIQGGYFDEQNSFALSQKAPCAKTTRWE